MEVPLLLDGHVSTAVAVGLRRMGFDAVALPEWRGGAYLDSFDHEILRAAHEERRVFVSFDVNTLPNLTSTLSALQSDHSGLVLISRKTFAQNEIGPITRSIAQFVRHWPEGDFTNQVLFLPRL